MSRKNASLKALQSPILVIVMIYISLVVLSLSSVSAEVETLGIFRQYNSVSLTQTCDNCTYINLTKVQLPNSSVVTIGKLMTQNGEEFNYTFTRTDSVGQYIATTCGDVDGTVTCASYDFQVTLNGRANPSEIVVVLFIIFILAILGSLIFAMSYTAIYFVDFVGDKERKPIYTVSSLIWNLSAYLVLMGLFWLSTQYLGNASVITILSWILFFTSITNIVFPFIAFFMSLAAEGWYGVIHAIKRGEYE